MAWIFSKAMMDAYGSLHCSQERGEEFSEVTFLDGKQSAPLNGIHTQLAYLSHGKMTEFSRLSRFGMMYKPLTVAHGEALLTSFLEDFHARTLVQQAEEKELKANDLQCGNTWQGSLAKYDQNLHLWKTAQCSLLEDSELFLVTWPRWGTMRSGGVYQQANLVLTTKEIEYGSLLPTPTCHNAKEGNYPAESTRKTPTLATYVGGKIHPHFTEWMMAWPQGWTDLKPLEMDKFQQWQQLHLLSCQKD